MADPITQSKNNPARKVDLSRELLLGQAAQNAFLSFLNDYLRGLPQYVDDVERDFGHDIYERMMRDPAIASAVTYLKTAVLAGGVRIVSPVSAPSSFQDDPEQQAAFDKAEEVREFIDDMLANLQEPLEDILANMLDALVFGHALAEETYALDGGRLRLVTLRVKPRKSYAFVVSKFMDVQGVIPQYRGTGAQSVVDAKDVIPRDKFFVLTFQSRGGDPRGTSLLRPAYNPWYLKQQVWPMYLKFLSQFGTPSIAAYLPPDAQDIEVTDAEGRPLLDAFGNPVMMSAAEAMLQKVVAFANGTAVVLDNEAKLDLIQSQGDGDAYTKAIDLFDRQITRAILIAVRTVMESEHGSRADSQTSQDVVADFVQAIRRSVEAAFYRDVIIPTVRYNFGDEAADNNLCPYLSLSDVAREDVTEVGRMIANLASAGLLHESQYPGIDAKLGLPERDFEAQMDELSALREMAREQTHWLSGTSPEPEPEPEED